MSGVAYSLNSFSSFSQSPEVHLYNVGSSQKPLPRLTFGGGSINSSSKGREGVSAVRFLMSSSLKKKPTLTQLITAGTRGTVRLWSIPKLKRGQVMRDISARCLWSIDTSESGEGLSDMLVLPSANEVPMDNATNDKPLVILGGNAGALVLLDTSRCTRKSFSTTVTPTKLAAWDLYQLASRELSHLDSNARLPARRWIGVNRMSLLQCNCSRGISSFKISLVLKCGWVLAVSLTLKQSLSVDKKFAMEKSDSYNATIRVEIVHRTPRIQVFNSLLEKVEGVGGMGLNCSLPDIPIPATAPINQLRQMIWLGSVKSKKYIMPSKDKYILNEQHGPMSSDASPVLDLESDMQGLLRHQGEGLFLLDVTNLDENTRLHSIPELGLDSMNNPSQVDPFNNNRTLARLSLPNGAPLSVEMHPAGEWMVIGYGMNGRVAAAQPLELVCMRKDCP